MALGRPPAPSWVRLGALLCSPPIFLITTSQLLSRDGRLIRATVLLANGRARGCCASALLRREEEGFQRLRSKTSLLVAVFSDFRGDKGTKSCQFIRRKFPNLWSHIYSSIFDIFDMHNSCVLAVVWLYLNTICIMCFSALGIFNDAAFAVDDKIDFPLPRLLSICSRPSHPLPCSAHSVVMKCKKYEKWFSSWTKCNFWLGMYLNRKKRWDMIFKQQSGVELWRI